MSGRGVTAEECFDRSAKILEATERIELALFGEDRRGGISNDLNKVVMRLERIENTMKQNNINIAEDKVLDVKRFGIMITAISTVLATIISSVVHAIFNGGGA